MHATAITQQFAIGAKKPINVNFNMHEKQLIERILIIYSAQHVMQKRHVLHR